MEIFLRSWRGGVILPVELDKINPEYFDDVRLLNSASVVYLLA